MIQQLVSVAFGLISQEGKKLGLPDFPIDSLSLAAKLLVKNLRYFKNLRYIRSKF